MFATLLGGLPRPLDGGGAPLATDDEAVMAALGAQVEAGLEPLTDGRLRDRSYPGALARLDGMAGDPGQARLSSVPTWRQPLTVDAWRFAAGHAGGLVKQTLPGPYTLGKRLAGKDRAEATAAFAAALRSEVLALAEAGCALIEIEELDAHLIGKDEEERRRFVEGHLALLDGVDGVHLSLSIVGGNADEAGIETILAAPYRSLAVDLIRGPDNWRLVRAVPGDRGIVCGALSTLEGTDDGPELLVWAAAYAASSNARGRERVGLATAGGLESLAWPQAVRKMERLGEAARLAGGPLSEAAKELDPRALDLRSAALGRYIPPAERPGRKPGGETP